MKKYFILQQKVQGLYRPKPVGISESVDKRFTVMGVNSKTKAPNSKSFMFGLKSSNLNSQYISSLNP